MPSPEEYERISRLMMAEEKLISSEEITAKHELDSRIAALAQQITDLDHSRVDYTDPAVQRAVARAHFVRLVDELKEHQVVTKEKRE